MKQERIFAGIDLHSNNVMISIVDEKGRAGSHSQKQKAAPHLQNIECLDAALFPSNHHSNF